MTILTNSRFKVIFNTTKAHYDWSDYQYDLGLEIGNGFDLKDMALVLSLAKKVADHYNDFAEIRIYKLDKDGDIDLNDIVESYKVFGA